MAIREFSGGYYKAEMSIQPYDDGPAIETGLHDYIAQQFYTKTDAPVTMRVGLDAGPMFTPSPESSIPTDVIGLPLSVIEDSELHPSDDAAAVLILKPEFAYMFNQTAKLGEQFEQSSNVDLSKEDKQFFNLSSNAGQGSREDY